MEHPILHISLKQVLNRFLTFWRPLISLYWFYIVFLLFFLFTLNWNFFFFSQYSLRVLYKIWHVLLLIVLLRFFSCCFYIEVNLC